MKTLLLALLLAIQADAQNTNLNLRLVGTNLFDFSKAGPSFHIIGNVTQIYPKSVEISIMVGQGYRLKSHSPIPAELMDTSDMLVALAAVRMGSYDNGSPRLISAGQYFSMSVEMRMMFEPFTEYRKYYLLNAKFAQVGQTLNATVVPTAAAGFYDCGSQFTGDTNDFKFFYRLVGDKIIKAAIATNQPSAKP
jgi:hypothetical protein